jgi:hypothetical protein
VTLYTFTIYAGLFGCGMLVAVLVWLLAWHPETATELTGNGEG